MGRTPDFHLLDKANATWCGLGMEMGRITPRLGPPYRKLLGPFSFRVHGPGRNYNLVAVCSVENWGRGPMEWLLDGCSVMFWG